MFFYRIILVLVLLSAQIITAQKFITVVDSETSAPIKDVLVESSNTKTTTVTDSNGRFNASVFSANDTIRLLHIAYHNKTVPVYSLKNGTVLTLKRKVLQQETVTVTGQGYDNQTSFNETITLSEVEKSRFVTLGDLLKTETSLYIKDYGGFAGVKTISSRGMSSENTIVLFNEARVNDLRTGIFDLSTMSPGTIAQIDFNKISKGELGYISPGGVLSLYSRSEFKKRTLQLSLKYDSNLYNSGFFSYGDGRKDLNFKINFERSYSPNHFSYRFEGVKRERTNSHFNKTFLDANFFAANKWLKINAYGMYSYFNSGIPGYVVTNNYNSSRASNLSRSLLGVIKGDFVLSDKFSFVSVNSYNKQTLQISDPDGIVIYQSDSKESKLNDFTTLNRLLYSSSMLNFTFGYEYNYSKLNDLTAFVSASNVPDNIKRNSNKFFTNTDYRILLNEKVIQSIMISGFAAYQHIDENLGERIISDEFAYSVGVKIIPATESYIAIKLNYANNFRYPTFNERYYSNLFNNNQLRPEKYKSFDAGIESRTEFMDGLTLSASYFLINADDKIIWVPTRLALQTPRNISKVTSQGVELAVKQKAFDNLLNVDIYYTYTDARNKTKLSEQDLSYDKLLIYSPQQQLNFNLTLNLKGFKLKTYLTYVSKRYYTSDNNPDSVLPQYVVFDASLSYSFRFLTINHSVVLTAYNIFNESYFIIQSYPMPLNTFLLTYNMEIQ